MATIKKIKDSAGNIHDIIDTTYSTVTTGAEGLCPQLPNSTTKYLRGDGTWVTPPDTNTTYTAGENVTISGTIISATDTTYTAGNNITISNNKISATDTTYSTVTTSTEGLCPKLSNDTTQYLRGDGKWITPPDTNTTYSTVTNSANGLCPQLPNDSTKYLRGDGTWATPPDNDTKYDSLKNPYSIKFKNASGTAVTYDGSSEVNLTGGILYAATAGAVTWDGVTGKPSTYTPSTHTHSASDLYSGYLNSHPENSPTIIPFLYNDLAFLNSKGGSYKVYKTTSTDFTAVTLNETQLNVSSGNNMFDGTPSYTMLDSSTGEYTVVIDMTLHRTFPYSNEFYIDFGAAAWRAKNISVYAMLSDKESTYTLKNSTNNNTKGNWTTYVSHRATADGVTTEGFNKLRVVLSGFCSTTNTTGKRISQIGLINYGSAGASETFISRGGCAGIYGSLIPQTAYGAHLGSSTKPWNTVYAANFTGNADSATKDYDGNNISTTYVKLNSGSSFQTIYSSGDTPLRVKNTTDGGSTYIAFFNKNGTVNDAFLGSIGVTSGKQLTFYNGSSNTVLHSGNYNNYSPSLTGTGASGSWNITSSGVTTSALSGATTCSLALVDGNNMKYTDTLKFDKGAETLYTNFLKPKSIFFDEDNTAEIGYSAESNTVYLSGQFIQLQTDKATIEGNLELVGTGIFKDSISVAGNISVGSSDFTLKIDDKNRALISVGDAKGATTDLCLTAEYIELIGLTDVYGNLTVSGQISSSGNIIADGDMQCDNLQCETRAEIGSAEIGSIETYTLWLCPGDVGGKIIFGDVDDSPFDDHNNHYVCIEEINDDELTFKADNGFVFNSFKGVTSNYGFFDTSDERLKDIVKPIEVDLDKLSKLRKVYFNWKDKENSSLQLGMIAQDVQEIYPELINESKDGILSLAYDKLSVITLEAIDVLHNENNELKNRIDKLESLVNQLIEKN